MSIVRKIITEHSKLTKEQIERIEAARERPIHYDDESPKLSKAKLKEFKRVSNVREKRCT